MGYSPGGQLVAFSGAVAFASFAKTDDSNRSLQTWTRCSSDLACNASLQSLDEEAGRPGLHCWTPPHITTGTEAEIQVSGGLLRDTSNRLLKLNRLNLSLISEFPENKCMQLLL